MILGLDFATATGWAHEDHRDPWFGTWDMSSGAPHPGRRFWELGKNLRELHAARPFTRIVAEDASFGARKDMLTTMAFHNAMKGVVLLTAYELDVRPTFVVPSQWKKWVRHGRLSKTESVNLAELLHGVKCRNDNEADAFWLLQYGLHLRQNGAPNVEKPKRKSRAKPATTGRLFE